jgi:preprotein translocase subunit YajC
MWKKIAVAGCTAALIGGVGTAALAATGTGSSSPSTTASGSSATGTAAAGKTKHHRAKEALLKLRALQHATWVTADKDGKTFLTHDAIRGSVTAVSPTSITVKSADNVSETYVVDSATKVHQRGTKTASSIAAVKTGDEVVVAGTGTSTLTATQILDGVKK